VLERLIAFSTERGLLVDWDVLEHVEVAWGGLESVDAEDLRHSDIL
jgi:hypothetical protein